MRKALLIAMTLFFATPNVKAQDKSKDEDVKIVLVKEENSDNYYYEGVVPVEGVTKEEMFRRAKEWVLSTFKTGDNNSQFDEKELSIYNTPTIALPKANERMFYVNFKLKLLFKDGKYKYRFDNLIAQYVDGAYTSAATPYKDNNTFKWKKIDKYITNNVNEILVKMTSDLETTIKTTKSKKDDW